MIINLQGVSVIVFSRIYYVGGENGGNFKCFKCGSLDHFVKDLTYPKCRLCTWHCRSSLHLRIAKSNVPKIIDQMIRLEVVRMMNHVAMQNGNISTQLMKIRLPLWLVRYGNFIRVVCVAKLVKLGFILCLRLLDTMIILL